MTRKWIAFLLVLLMLLSAVGGALAVTDMAGREVALDAPATRIIALMPADCEILCAIGAEDLLVGRGAYCDYPESIQALPVVESGADMNVEQILALAPQVVVMSVMAQTVEQTAALENAGVKVLVSDAQTIEGTYSAIRMLGEATGKTAEAEALVADMQSCFAELAAQSQASGKTVYFEASPLAWGLWTTGRGTFMDELAALCGLTNAFADVEGWAEISEEQVLARDPDYIVTVAMDTGEGMTPVEEIKSRTGWQDLKAVQEDHILLADSNAMSRPGPRLMDAALALYGFVYGADRTK